MYVYMYVCNDKKKMQTCVTTTLFESVIIGPVTRISYMYMILPVCVSHTDIA